MLTKDLSSLTSSQMCAINSAISTMDDLIESVTLFVKQGGHSYKTFLEDRNQLIEKITTLPESK